MVPKNIRRRSKTDFQPASVGSKRGASQRALDDLESMLQRLPVGLVAFSADGAVLATNPMAAGLLNAPPELVDPGTDVRRLETHLQSLADGQDGAPPGPALELRDLVKGRPGQQVEYRLSDGKAMLASGAPLGGGGGVVALTDVTLRAVSEEWARRGQTMRALGDMAGGVAHNFNTLLTTIIGFSRLAMDKPGEIERVSECLGEILEAAGRAAELTRDMLVFGQEGLCECETIELGSTLHAMDAILQGYTEDAVDLSLEISDDPMPVDINHNQLCQSIVALVKRGRTAMPDGGPICIRCEPIVLNVPLRCSHGDELPRGPYARIVVTDAGAALDPGDRERLFEPFADAADPNTPGDSIGLACVYGMVRTFMGAVDVRSEPGEGTTVTLFLPISQSAVPSLTAAAQSLNPMILVVEDNAHVCRLVERVLSDAGFEVITAQDGASALTMYETHRERVALLLTDVAMPGMDGVELSRLIQGEQPGLRVVYMSGHTPGEPGPGQALAGNVVFLRKPFEPDALDRIVRDTLDAASG